MQDSAEFAGQRRICRKAQNLQDSEEYAGQRRICMRSHDTLNSKSAILYYIYNLFCLVKTVQARELYLKSYNYFLDFGWNLEFCKL
jgi:hypothetical protein